MVEVKTLACDCKSNDAIIDLQATFKVFLLIARSLFIVFCLKVALKSAASFHQFDIGFEMKIDIKLFMISC